MADMNGENGHACHVQDWKVGLRNAATKKFLTAESFGSFNVSGTLLKKKQIWTLEQDRSEDNVVYIKSYLDKKIATEPKHGEIDTEVEGHDEKFVVEYGTGKYSGLWLFKHKKCCTYLGTNPNNPENVLCKATKTDDNDSVYWTVQLCIHPQINLRNVKRTRYAHLENDQLRCSEVVPWGTDALITLEYIDGKYAFKTSDSRYLQNDGSLVPECNDNCKFFLEIKSGKESGLAFKDVNQCYLTAVGPGTLKTNKKSVTKDELFTIEDSHPQVFFISNKGKKASIKQGVDVSANQDTDEDTETFQLEHQKEDKWAVLASNGKYWTVAGSGIQAVSSSVKKECLFDLDWQGDGTVGIKASNSKYVSHKDTGALAAVADTLTEKEKFKVQIMNRPILVLKCKHGFVGTKPKSQEFACNRADYNIFNLEPDGDGKYTLQDPSTGKYWRVDEEGVVVSDDSPSHFVIEFRKKTYISIKAGDFFLQGKQNGRIMAKATDLDCDETGNDITLWEF